MNWGGFASQGAVKGQERRGPGCQASLKAALTFLERTVDIDIKKYPVVSWKWKVENILRGIDERTMEGDNHPVRIFFVFAPEASKYSLWFRLKRFLYLDRIHGHPSGGRFTEYLWSSHLKPGDVINDPGNHQTDGR
jgi:hypothetical protein